MTIVSNPSADSLEKVEQAAKILRQSKKAKQVFEFVYTGKKRFKSIEEIKKGVAGFNTNTYVAAARLAAEDIFDKKSENGKVFYGKKEFYTHNQDRIIRLSENAQRLKDFPTKRNARVISQHNTFSFRTNPKPRSITIDEIDSFNKIQSIGDQSLPDVKGLTERAINHGICVIVGAVEKKDWPGERNDIFGTSIQVKGKRITAAFALKGRGKKGILYPIMMGKNGDQIPRLFQGTARIHFVIHNNAIHESVYDLLQTHAIQKSIETGEEIYYCIIDGNDLSRIVAAYPEAFSNNTPL